MLVVARASLAQSLRAGVSRTSAVRVDARLACFSTVHLPFQTSFARSMSAAPAASGGSGGAGPLRVLEVRPGEAGATPTFAEAERAQKELGDHDVRIEVQACGVCHTDFFMFGREGAVPGHEIIGTVVEAGSESAVEVGTRVGAGWQTNSCHACGVCRDGYEQYCSDMTNYFSAPNGGFASHVTWDSRHVFRIPDELPSVDAAPLLCAGATTFSAIADSGVRPGDTIGVIGIGGLGHIAVQFARAWGCNVVALTRSADKTEQAIALGAHEVLITTDADAMNRARGSINLLLSTVPGNLDLDMYMKLVAPRGSTCIVGIAGKPLEVGGSSLIMGGRSLSGSLIAGSKNMEKMLQMAVLHKVKPQVETFPMTAEGCAAAVAKIHDNTIRFRAVLVPE